jgi:uroporphyrinogen decarboxylase
MLTPTALSPEFLALTPNLDLPAFWAENEACFEFTPHKPRCALTFSPDDHWLFEFIPPESTLRYFEDKAYRDALHQQANRYLQEYIGRPYFDEDTWQTSPRRIENLFTTYFTYREGSTPWLTPATDNPQAFERILNEAAATDIATWAFPEEFLAEWEARKAAGKPLPLLGSGSRGPATIMTSVLSPENLFYWMVDYPELIQRFRDILAEKMVELNLALRQFSGNTQPGWYILDDNSALFNTRLYREYCYPVLERVLDALAPGDAPRYQHSDSAMGHLLDMQYQLGIRAVNYGPSVDAGLIRRVMPDALIHGQLPPFLLRNGTAEEIRARVIEDFHKAGAEGGLVVTTAGSLAAGTGLGRMRWLMQVVQEETRY